MNTDVVQTVAGRKVRLLGHWIYVRKCVAQDVIDKATGKLLLELPQWSKDFAEQPFAWVEVLAIGPKVGKPALGDYWLERKATQKYAKHIPNEMEIGDLVLIPNQPWKFMHSPYAPTKGIDFFIDETVPVCISREDET